MYDLPSLLHPPILADTPASQCSGRDVSAMKAAFQSFIFMSGHSLEKEIRNNTHSFTYLAHILRNVSSDIAMDRFAVY